MDTYKLVCVYVCLCVCVCFMQLRKLLMSIALEHPKLG